MSTAHVAPSQGGTSPLVEEDSIKLDSKMHVSLIRQSASDSMVVAAAKVSTLGHAVEAWEDADAESSKGLINFLMKNRHGTPFEHGLFTFRVCVPIFVMRELHRHRIGFSYNEESGRYKQFDPHFYYPAESRPLVQQGKPGHYEFVPGSRDQFLLTFGVLSDNAENAWTRYTQLLNQGIAKEVARMVLPVNIYSSCYVSCNARSLMSLLSLRTKREDSTFPSYPQREIEMMAEGMEEHFKMLMPITHASFDANGRVSP